MKLRVVFCSNVTLLMFIYLALIRNGFFAED